MPESWRIGVKDGYRTKEIQVGNCTVRIHRPILDEQERVKAEDRVRDALRGLMKERN